MEFVKRDNVYVQKIMLGLIVLFLKIVYVLIIVKTEDNVMYKQKNVLAMLVGLVEIVLFQCVKIIVLIEVNA